VGCEATNWYAIVACVNKRNSDKTSDAKLLVVEL